MTTVDITFHRLSNVYCCVGGQNDGLRLRERLDTVLRRFIARHIEAFCTQILQGSKDSVWLVRRLEAECTINASWHDEDIAFAWAKQIVLSLSNELAAGGSDNVLSFANEAAYLARFVTDLANGDAWSKWYYQRFAGLAALPSSSALRTALVTGQATGATALRMLAANELDSVLETLSPDDALQVLHMCSGLPDHTSLEEAAAVAAPIAQIARRYSPADPRWAIEVFIVASRQRDSGGATLLAAIAALALAARPDTNEVESFAEVPAWVEQLGGLDALTRLPKDVIVSTSTQDSALGQETRTTPFGGGFLLLPLLFDFPLEDWVAAWPQLADIPPAPVLRALLLAKCQGSVRCSQFLHDPLWLELLGLPVNVDWQVLMHELAGLGMPARKALCDALAVLALEYGTEKSQTKEVQSGRLAWRISYDELEFWHGLVSVQAQERVLETDQDLEYLALPQEFSLACEWDALLSLGAQQLLRRFARRVPGFSLSHFDYLYRNFLAMTAQVERDGECYIVRLSRPPLALMLSITGMMRTAYDLPWRPGFTCALYPEEA